jgi:hypothetical protein
MDRAAQTIAAALDAKLPARFAALRAAQLAEQIKRGRFVQVLPTHKAPPADGAKVAADDLKTPPSRDDSLAALKLSAPDEWRERVDFYHGPQGQGFALTVQFASGGKVYQRTLAHGPESHWEKPWAEVPA